MVLWHSIGLEESRVIQISPDRRHSVVYLVTQPVNSPKRAYFRLDLASMELMHLVRVPTVAGELALDSSSGRLFAFQGAEIYTSDDQGESWQLAPVLGSG